MLTIEQRDRLLTAQERRMQLRRRSHLAGIAKRLQAPDYFQHMAQRAARDVMAAWARAEYAAARRATNDFYGADPYNMPDWHPRSATNATVRFHARRGLTFMANRAPRGAPVC